MTETPDIFDGSDDLVESGTWGEVRHAIRANGTMEAKGWLEDAANREAHRFDHLFRKVCNGYRITNVQQFRHLDDGIYEFKRARHRIFCFREGRCWRLTHYYPKGKQKCPPGEIERAKQIRKEHLTRQ